VNDTAEDKAVTRFALESYHALLSDMLNARHKARGNDTACDAIRVTMLRAERLAHALKLEDTSAD
jgi:hypothetical protein